MPLSVYESNKDLMIQFLLQNKILLYKILYNMNFELTIIIPVYNEEDNLDRVHQEMKQFLTISKKKTKILFVNDGSKDNSQSLIEKICKDNEEFTFISFEKNAGLSAAIKAGFDYTDTPWVGYIDADLQTAPEDFNILMEFTGEFDLVTGVRSNRKDSFTKNMSSNHCQWHPKSFYR